MMSHYGMIVQVLAVKLFLQLVLWILCNSDNFRTNEHKDANRFWFKTFFFLLANKTTIHHVYVMLKYFDYYITYWFGTRRLGHEQSIYQKVTHLLNGKQKVIVSSDLFFQRSVSENSLVAMDFSGRIGRVIDNPVEAQSAAMEEGHAWRVSSNNHFCFDYLVIY